MHYATNISPTSSELHKVKYVLQHNAKPAIFLAYGWGVTRKL